MGLTPRSGPAQSNVAIASKFQRHESGADRTRRYGVCRVAPIYPVGARRRTADGCCRVSRERAWCEPLFGRWPTLNWSKVGRPPNPSSPRARWPMAGRRVWPKMSWMATSEAVIAGVARPLPPTDAPVQTGLSPDPGKVILVDMVVLQPPQLKRQCACRFRHRKDGWRCSRVEWSATRRAEQQCVRGRRP